MRISTSPKSTSYCPNPTHNLLSTTKIKPYTTFWRLMNIRRLKDSYGATLASGTRKWGNRKKPVSGFIDCTGHLRVLVLSWPGMGCLHTQSISIAWASTNSPYTIFTEDYCSRIWKPKPSVCSTLLIIIMYFEGGGFSQNTRLNSLRFPQLSST